MKRVIRKILGIVGNRLPDAVWRRVLMVFLENKRLVDRLGALYLSQVASQLNLVLNKSVVGRYGAIVGAPNDLAVLKACADTGTWAEGTFVLWL
jgi:hypothetical protein